jgi:outer membrane protein OmpA-like peptidoglycan-associated protein
LQGYLIDSVSGQPVTGIITAVDQSEGTEVAPIYTSRTGFFEFDLVGNRKYVLVVLGNNAVTIRENVPLTVDTLVNIFSRNLPTGRPIVFETLEFQKNSAEIERQTIPRIKLLGDFLKKYPEVRVTIRGHTDADGDADFNLQLSQERAENIRRLLLRSSAQADTFVRAEGYGESRPVFPNDSPEHKAVNRRVEFELTIPPKYRSKLGVETLVFDDRTTGALEERLGEDELDEPVEPAAEADDALDPETDAMLGDLEEESIDDFSGMLGDLLDEIDDDMATRRDTTALDSSATDSLGRPIKRPSTRAPAKPDVVGKKTDKPPTKPINKKEEEEEEYMEDLDDEGDG